MGTRMTFVTEEEGINVFLKSKEVNFELAVQNPVYRTGKQYFQIVHLKYNRESKSSFRYQSHLHCSIKNEAGPLFCSLE